MFPQLPPFIKAVVQKQPEQVARCQQLHPDVLENPLSDNDESQSQNKGKTDPDIESKAFLRRVLAASSDGGQGHSVVSRQHDLKNDENGQQRQNLSPLVSAIEDVGKRGKRGEVHRDSLESAGLC